MTSQANSLWPWHLSKKGGGEKLVWDMKFCTLNPQRFFIPHHLYRNPQETAKSISFEIGPAYTQNRCSSHPAQWSISFGLLKWGKKKDNRYFLRC